MTFCILVYKNKDLLFTLNRGLYMLLDNLHLKRIRYNLKKNLLLFSKQIKLIENYI